jgi:hypothetical protein
VQNLLDDLQRDVDALQAQYERLLATHDEQDAHPTPAAASGSPTGSVAAAHRAYVQLAQAKRALTLENEELKQLRRRRRCCGPSRSRSTSAGTPCSR